MPTIMRENGWGVHIYTDDHAPPHVHVTRPEGYAKVHLAGDDGAPEIVRIRGLSDHEAWRALAIVCKHQQLLLHEWRNIHG